MCELWQSKVRHMLTGFVKQWLHEWGKRCICMHNEWQSACRGVTHAYVRHVRCDVRRAMHGSAVFATFGYKTACAVPCTQETDTVVPHGMCSVARTDPA